MDGLCFDRQAAHQAIVNAGEALNSLEGGPIGHSHDMTERDLALSDRLIWIGLFDDDGLLNFSHQISR